MKGLSPVVASIILIAFAVAVGGLVSIWLTGFATETTDFTSEQGEKQTACAGARLQVDSVTESIIILSNPSPKTITNITIYDELGRNLTVLNNFTDLVPGQVADLSWTRSNNNSIFMRGICEGTIIVEGACKDSQICWK